MSLKFRLAFGAIALAQVFLLIGLVGQREFSLRHGTEVILETYPVDPRSPFQGDYAILLYKISRPPPEVEFSARDSVTAYSAGDSAYVFSAGDSVYIYLEEGPESWRGVDYRPKRDGSDKRPFIKGRVVNHGNIDFGIDTYFVPEGTGFIIEEAEDVKVVVSVDGRGRAIIKDVLVDGIPFDQALEQLSERRKSF